MGYIYKIINDLNDKVYVGMTRFSLEKRWKEHKRKYKERKTHLYMAMNAYGIEHFQIIELEECPNENLIEREAFWINELDSFKNGYNMTEGKGEGTGNCIQARPVRQYDIDGNFIAEYKSLSQAGDITNTDPMNIRRAAVHDCNSAGGFQWRFLDDTIPVQPIILPRGGGKGKKVLQYTLEGELVGEFPSARAAGRALGTYPTGIVKCCNKKQETFKGYKWKYADLD